MEWDIPRTTVGAVIELLVASDLMIRGYHVFRALSPSAPADLVIFRDDAQGRIEVRFVQKRTSGAIIPRAKAKDACDLYAFVDSDRNIYYRKADAPLISVSL